MGITKKAVNLIGYDTAILQNINEQREYSVNYNLYISLHILNMYFDLNVKLTHALLLNVGAYKYVTL